MGVVRCSVEAHAMDWQGDALGGRSPRMKCILFDICTTFELGSGSANGCFTEGTARHSTHEEMMLVGKAKAGSSSDSFAQNTRLGESNITQCALTQTLAMPSTSSA